MVDFVSEFFEGRIHENITGIVRIDGANVFDAQGSMSQKTSTTLLDGCLSISETDSSFTTTTLRTAVTAWCDDSSKAARTYGHISSWDTSRVEDMSSLFSNSDSNSTGYCSTYYTFDEDISQWDVSSVKDDFNVGASSSNSDLSSWTWAASRT